MGLLEARSIVLTRPDNLLGKGIVNNCLMCHSATIAGQTVIGAGNASQVPDEFLVMNKALYSGVHEGVPQ